MTGEDSIRAQPLKRCPLCGSHERKLLYDQLSDHLFGAPGEWTLKQCLCCGLIFLDPQPLESEVWKAYRNYYTHSSETIPRKAPGPLQMLRKLLGLSNRLVSRALLITRERALVSNMYLSERISGRLLDVGCGQGSFLLRMRQTGWSVAGIEPDPQAAEIARTRFGLDVHIGDLPSARHPGKHFDAVTMNHVIEHVHDPVALLRECRRILKPGGVLVAVTPNTRSWGYRKFTRDWRGLEPPRHLCLFSPDTLRRCAEEAGFKAVHVWTTAANAEALAAGSLEIQDTGRHDMSARQPIRRRMSSLLLQYQETILTRVFANAGEEIVLWAENG